MPFCWPSCFLLFCLQLFSLSLLFLHRLVVWGWGLRTDRVSISLSLPCQSFLIIIIIISVVVNSHGQVNHLYVYTEYNLLFLLRE